MQKPKKPGRRTILETAQGFLLWVEVHVDLDHIRIIELSNHTVCRSSYLIMGLDTFLLKPSAIFGPLLETQTTQNRPRQLRVGAVRLRVDGGFRALLQRSEEKGIGRVFCVI